MEDGHRGFSGTDVSSGAPGPGTAGLVTAAVHLDRNGPVLQLVEGWLFPAQKIPPTLHSGAPGGLQMEQKWPAQPSKRALWGVM